MGEPFLREVFAVYFLPIFEAASSQIKCILNPKCINTFYI